MIKLFDKIKCKNVKTGHNPVCILTVKNIKIINDVTLYSGKYILKDIRKEKISNKDINILKSLSDLKLVPKIYFIDKTKIIMEYFDGITLTQYLKNHKLSKELFLKIQKLIRKWHRLGYAHGDLALLFNKDNKLVGGDNLLIGKNNNLMLIDPILGKILTYKISQFEEKKKWDLEFLKELKFYINNSISNVFKLTKK